MTIEQHSSLAGDMNLNKPLFFPLICKRPLWAVYRVKRDLVDDRHLQVAPFMLVQYEVDLWSGRRIN